MQAAYLAAHTVSADDVATALDGMENVVRIRTPVGATHCMNWRDVDRFDVGKGKAIYVLACNR